MMRFRWLVVAALTLFAFTCSAWIAGCPNSPACVGTAVGSGLLGPAVVMLAILAGPAFVATFRATWLLAEADRHVRQLPCDAVPAKLREAVRRTGVPRVQCIADPSPAAFCAGALRPSIYVTRSLVGQLRPLELEAVLLHEQYHASRRDPLRRAFRRAIGEVFFFVPVIGWWSERALEASELAADRYAVRCVGVKPVASALWRVADRPSLDHAVAFGGAAELRVAQLLGDHIARSTPPPALWLASIAGIVLGLSSAWCLSHVLTTIA